MKLSLICALMISSSVFAGDDYNCSLSLWGERKVEIQNISLGYARAAQEIAVPEGKVTLDFTSTGRIVDAGNGPRQRLSLALEGNGEVLLRAATTFTGLPRVISLSGESAGQEVEVLCVQK